MYIGEKWLPYRGIGAEHSFFIHSSFDKVINISTDTGIMAIAAEAAGASSSFIVVSGGNLGCNSTIGRRCFIKDGILRLDGETFNFRNASIWKGPIGKDYKNYRIKIENIAALKAVLDRKAAENSAWRQIHDYPAGSHSNTASRFDGLKAVLKLDKNPLEARNLIGLGQGLTPAGDDILLGFLAVVNHTWKNREYAEELHKTISALVDKTADISKQALVNALNGDYHEYIQNCIRDLCEGNSEEVYISAASLLKMGATSGSDIACGIYFGMRGANAFQDITKT